MVSTAENQTLVFSEKLHVPFEKITSQTGGKNCLKFNVLLTLIPLIILEQEQINVKQLNQIFDKNAKEIKDVILELAKQIHLNREEKISTI